MISRRSLNNKRLLHLVKLAASSNCKKRLPLSSIYWKWSVLISSKTILLWKCRAIFSTFYKATSCTSWPSGTSSALARRLWCRSARVMSSEHCSSTSPQASHRKFHQTCNWRKLLKQHHELLPAAWKLTEMLKSTWFRTYSADDTSSVKIKKQLLSFNY